MRRNIIRMTNCPSTIVHCITGQFMPVITGRSECQARAAQPKGGVSILFAGSASQRASPSGRERRSYKRPACTYTRTGGGMDIAVRINRKFNLVTLLVYNEKIISKLRSTGRFIKPKGLKYSRPIYQLPVFMIGLFILYYFSCDIGLLS